MHDVHALIETKSDHRFGLGRNHFGKKKKKAVTKTESDQISPKEGNLIIWVRESGMLRQDPL